MDKEWFKFTAFSVATLLNTKNFNKETFVKYVTKLSKELKEKEKQYEYPKEAEDQQEKPVLNF